MPTIRLMDHQLRWIRLFRENRRFFFRQLDLGAGTRESMAAYANELAKSGPKPIVVAPTLLHTPWNGLLNYDDPEMVTPQRVAKLGDGFCADRPLFVDVGFHGEQKMAVLRRAIEHCSRCVVRMDIKYGPQDYVGPGSHPPAAVLCGPDWRDHVPESHKRTLRNW